MLKKKRVVKDVPTKEEPPAEAKIKTSPPKPEEKALPSDAEKPKKLTKREKQKRKTNAYISKFESTNSDIGTLLDELLVTLESGKVVYKGKIGSLKARVRNLKAAHDVYFGLNRRTPRDSGGLSSKRYISPKMAIFLGRKTNDEIMWRNWTSLFAAYMRENKLNVHTDLDENGKVVSGRYVRPDEKLVALFGTSDMFLYTHAQRLARPHLSKTPFGEDGLPLPEEDKS